jgi:hypothetical protein
MRGMSEQRLTRPEFVLNVLHRIVENRVTDLDSGNVCSIGGAVEAGVLTAKFWTMRRQTHRWRREFSGPRRIRSVIDVFQDSVDDARCVFGQRFADRDSSPTGARGRGGYHAAGAAVAGSPVTTPAPTSYYARSGRQPLSTVKSRGRGRHRRPTRSCRWLREKGNAWPSAHRLLRFQRQGRR